MRSVEDFLLDLAAATASLTSRTSKIIEAEARGASLLPGWTRGHVLTHLARNAEGGARLLSWARTGVPSYEYLSVAARAAAIENGANRPASVLAADVAATAAAFTDAAMAMPADAWKNPVTWTTGQDDPAENVVRSRLAEVLIHHVDLDLGYGPGGWPAAFVSEMLPAAAGRVNERALAPLSAQLTATDTGQSFRVGGEAPERVSGTAAELLAWLLGRSDGAGLDRDKLGPLPYVASIYYT
ncbi:MAG: maleylpyruvate isomerase family mycothiol-dependent enzyme [Actinomycetota bacterium]|nr:maleylpyruvate isomerase family mycothiol-dependent enzyme [Actinomycetota bacterium]